MKGRLLIYVAILGMTNVAGAPDSRRFSGFGEVRAADQKTETPYYFSL